MKIEQGSTRIVLLFGWFVLKFPIFTNPDWVVVYSVLKLGIRKCILRKKESNFTNFNFLESLFTTLTPLTDGLSSNWLEFYYYLKTRNKFLVPTYFSFFGLINIQRQVEKIEINPGDLKYPFKDFFSIINGYYSNSSFEVNVRFTHHMLAESYCWGSDGGLMIFDYGDKSVFPFISEKGEKMHKKFCKTAEIKVRAVI